MSGFSNAIISLIQERNEAIREKECKLMTIIRSSCPMAFNVQRSTCNVLSAQIDVAHRLGDLAIGPIVKQWFRT
jgi:hypothetical protein